MPTAIDHVSPMPTDHEPSGLAVETQGLHKRFGRHEVLRGVNLQIPEGARSAVMGPSGTGKSVLLKLIVGMLPPDRGEVCVRGRRLSTMRSRDILDLRLEVGVMYQDGALFSSITVGENVAFPLRQHTDLQEAEIQEVVHHQLTAVGLHNDAHKYPSELSGGMRKRAGLARALALDPPLLICDEPDSGLDPVRTALLGELLIANHEERGGTLLVVTHNVRLARLISDHASILWEGRIVETGPSEQMWESENRFVQQFLSADVQGPLGMD